jgi:protein-S-isoprenylcysteine O-methyltransferase Ste14
MDKVRRNAVTYFAIQGMAVLAWWIVLFVYPQYRAAFRLEPGSDTSLLSFLLPDVFLISLGSLAAAALVHFKNRFEVAVLWFVTGAISYASIYTFAFTFMTDRGWLGVGLMLAAALWSGVFSTGITVGSEMFRASKESSTNYIVIKTFVQILIVWTVILVVFPYLITILEDKLGIARLEFSFQRPLAAAVFVLVSSVGIWAAYSMSRIGRGTPLPLDHANKLVVLGPYAYVRNPMAVSGSLQGLAVALFLGSPLVALYALFGSLIWQLIFRPLEEQNLTGRFGSAFVHYQGNVRCWIPRISAYHIDSTTDSSNSLDSPFGSM